MFSEIGEEQPKAPPVEIANMGCLQLFNMLNAKPIPANVQEKWFMHVKAIINRKWAQALIDTEVSHNFIKVDEAKRLELKVEKMDGWLKTMNSEAKPLSGVMRDVELHLGPWRGKANFSVVSLASCLCFGHGIFVKVQCGATSAVQLNVHLRGSPIRGPESEQGHATLLTFHNSN